ncbi:bcl-2-modifying factor-like isoform X1 [Melanotaenia boesemani]|uniref:bcl-2-modifying factor-like isoform X1 n=1 Tax=Melanotaenia boesemani TaxID=1250792 RepID=UPI001C051AFE|nr:bcl-2-modifying factor-like isoform X1 [Melanotaenia boesemani]
MDDEEDDVFEPDPPCWRTTFREIKSEDRGTQTPGPALVSNNGMLPCGVAEEPRPLFYGNAGFRLHFPAHFELVGDLEVRQQASEDQQNGMERLPWHQPVARSVEACIGQKLQLIGDQFHREHLQLTMTNQFTPPIHTELSPGCCQLAVAIPAQRLANMIAQRTG